MLHDKIVIVIDVDGVLLDIHSELECQLRQRGFEFSMNRVLTYDFNKSLPTELAPQWLVDTDTGFDNWCNAPRQEIFSLFADTALFMNAPFCLSAIEQIRRMCYSGLYHIIIHTKSFTEPVADVKEKRLRSLLPFCNLEIRHTIGSKNDKVAIACADYVLEDCIANLTPYACRGYLIDQPYNREIYNAPLPENIIRVSNAYIALCAIDTGVVMNHKQRKGYSRSGNNVQCEVGCL